MPQYHVWVIDTIYRAKKISFKELNERWLNADISRGVEIFKRTFDNWRYVIWDMEPQWLRKDIAGKVKRIVEQVQEKIIMQDFAAIDFETANNERSSVCSVGIIIVRNSEIVDSFYSLIKPEPEYYNYWCSQVHGLCAADTESAPTFPEVWRKIEPLIEGLPLVAHNKAFDESCLKAVFRVYQMDYPEYEFHCTCVASRRKLPELENHQLHTVAAACGYRLKNHHHALADAEACAWIAREIL